MKKLMTIAVLFSVMMAVTGCLTRASAHTKKTVYSDGRVVYESDTSIIGTGDKASQVAGEGMFADGTEEDLGAGFKKGNASQQSTGIGETLNGLGALMGGMAKFMAASQGVKAPQVVIPDADSSVENSPETVASAALPAMSEVLYSTDGYGGAPGTAGEGVYGRPSCGRCRAYRAAHPDTQIINLDDPANRAAMWAALRARGFKGTSAALPVAVTEDGYTAAAR